MLNVKRILAATKLDGSDERVLAHAALLAGAHDTELHVIHVLSEHASPLPDEATVLATQEKLEQSLPPEKIIKLDVHWEVCHGDSTTELARYIREHEIDLVVVGSHGKFGLTSLFSKHVSAELLSRQLCPVVVVPLGQTDEEPSLTQITETLLSEFGETISGSREATASQIRDFIAKSFRLVEDRAEACVHHLEAIGVLNWESSSDTDVEAGGEPLVTCRVNLAAGHQTHGDLADFGPQAAAETTPALDLLLRAIRLRATDLHMDPLAEGHEYSIRMRIDGRLAHYCNLSDDLARHHIQQFKVLANVRTGDPFSPQEASLRLPGGRFDCHARLTTAPVAGGESLCLRIQSKSAIVRPLEQLGFSPENDQTVSTILSRGEGLVLVTGPTGSGKTTSVYSMLNQLCPDGNSRNIVTIEDPVEYDLPFLRQMNVDPAHGRTLSKGLQTVLRMDPDVVFVGEIRDGETAQTAMRAASSGKYVFSTLHTRDVASTLTALFDLGIDPRSLAGNLGGIISQRLLRRLCTHCREQVTISDVDRALLLEHEIELGDTFYASRGCDQCRSTGYFGRVGVYETLSSSDVIVDAIQQKLSEEKVRAVIRNSGTHSLIQNALNLTVDGTTSIDEVRDMTRIA